jgi:hypothetical protein
MLKNFTKKNGSLGISCITMKIGINLPMLMPKRDYNNSNRRRAKTTTNRCRTNKREIQRPKEGGLIMTGYEQKMHEYILPGILKALERIADSLEKTEKEVTQEDQHRPDATYAKADAYTDESGTHIEQDIVYRVTEK